MELILLIAVVVIAVLAYRSYRRPSCRPSSGTK